MIGFRRRNCFCNTTRPATAAQRADPTPTIRSSSQEVLLEVLARDKRGRPVRDLERNQFRIMEDGAPVQITGFRLVERKTGAIDAEGLCHSAGSRRRAVRF